ncbi:MAG: O-antigen ligase family protein [Gammaproteobacteria bacterium]
MAIAFAFGATMVASEAAYELVVIAFLLSATIAVSAAWATRALRFPPTWLDAIVALLAAWLILVVLQSDAIATSASGSLRIGLLFLAYLAARWLPVDSVHSAVFCTVLAACAIVVWGHFALGTSLGGSFVYRHMFAVTVLVGAMLGVGSISSGRILGNFALIIAGTLVFLLIGLGGSRGVLLSAIAGVVVALVLGNRANRIKGGYLIAGGIIGLIAANLLLAGHLSSRIATLSEPLEAGRIRFVLWKSVLPLIEASPITGYGPGMLQHVWPPFRAVNENTAGYFAHNSYLDFAVAGGIPAMLMVIGLFLLALHAAWRAKAAWPAAALTVLFIHGLVDFTLLVSSPLFLLGITLATLAPHARPLATGVAPVFRRWTLLMGSTFLLGFTVYAVTSVVGYYHQHVAAERFSAGDVNDAFERLSSAIRWWPSADLPRTQRAHVLAVTVLESEGASTNPMIATAFSVAQNDAANAIRINPFGISGYLTAARVARAGHALGLAPMGDQESEDLLRTALSRNPRSITVRMELAEILRERGEREVALAVLMGGIAYKRTWSPSLDAYHAAARELATALGDDEALARIPQNQRVPI